MLTAAVLFASGVGIGVLGTFIGAGGGWMIVPLLLLGFRFTPQQAVGTSLAVVFLNALLRKKGTNEKGTEKGDP